MDVTMSSFEITLLKALKTTKNTPPPPPPPPPQSNVDVRLDHLSPWLNNIDQGGAKGGAIVEPNQRDRLSVGKKVQNVLTLFVQGCNISSHEGLALKT